MLSREYVKEVPETSMSNLSGIVLRLLAESGRTLVRNSGRTQLEFGSEGTMNKCGLEVHSYLEKPGTPGSDLHGSACLRAGIFPFPVFSKPGRCKTLSGGMG